MAFHRDNRQARLEILIERYRESQKQRTLKRAIALWNRAEADRSSSRYAAKAPVEKLN